MAQEPQLLTLKQRIAALNAAHLGRNHSDKQNVVEYGQKSSPQLSIRQGPPPLPVRTPSREITETLQDESANVQSSAASIATQTQCQLPPVPVRKEQHMLMEPSQSKAVARVTNATATISKPTPPLPARRPVKNATIEKQHNNNRTIPAGTTHAPPVPTASRPKVTAIRSSEILDTSGTSSPESSDITARRQCMICRDFRSPDQHALLFPRQEVTSLETLALGLTAPFPSPTDQARAIFTWMHHNIDYNVADFFSGNLKASTPSSTLRTGLAVCEGYASLFVQLANHAGLECIAVSGHGKGFGHVSPRPGVPLPPYSGNHAWNAVRIDHGEWKLIDSCWGAGHVRGAGQPYTRKFAPERFTQSNEEFGIDHFPSDGKYFFLPGDRRLTWLEYIQINPSFWPYDFERPTFFDNAKDDYSIGRQTVVPPSRAISVQQPGLVRFQFGLFCPHWTHEHHTKKGPPPVFILAPGGMHGGNKTFVPLEHYRPNGEGGGGDMWYTDVAAKELGAVGETLTCFAVTSFGNRQDARGLSVQDFRDGVGRVTMGFVGIVAWDLV